MQDLPQNLLQHIKDFEDVFTVDRAKLKEIVNHFVKELEKGMCCIFGDTNCLVWLTRVEYRSDC